MFGSSPGARWSDALACCYTTFPPMPMPAGLAPRRLLPQQQADRQHYPIRPIPGCCALLAGFHGVDVERIVIAASASEFIHRITAHGRDGLRCAVSPAHGYGDLRAGAQLGFDCGTGRPYGARALHWACEPASLLAWRTALAAWVQRQAMACCACSTALICPAAPGRSGTALPGRGLAAVVAQQGPGPDAGVRSAIAPAAAVTDGSAAALRALAPSWLLGWMAWRCSAPGCRPTRRIGWPQSPATCAQPGKAAQLRCAPDLAGPLPGSLANFFTARPPVPDLAAVAGLRARRASSCATARRSAWLAMCAWACWRRLRRALAAAWRQWAP